MLEVARRTERYDERERGRQACLAGGYQHEIASAFRLLRLERTRDPSLSASKRFVVVSTKGCSARWRLDSTPKRTLGQRLLDRNERRFEVLLRHVEAFGDEPACVGSGNVPSAAIEVARRSTLHG